MKYKSRLKWIVLPAGLLLISALFQNCAPGFLLNGESSISSQNEDDHLIIDDMVLDKGAIQVSDDMADVSTSAASGFGVYNSQPWTEGIVPIQFYHAISQSRRDFFMNICNEWTTGTKLKCKLRNGEANYVHVLLPSQSGLCNSQVGAGSGGRRFLNLGDRCWVYRSVRHEIGHMLGFMHEHQRPDRDQYVVINYNNIRPEYLYAFDKFKHFEHGGPYDFSSVMHYPTAALSTEANKTTIYPKAQYADQAKKMGSWVLSSGDHQVMGQIYGRIHFSTERKRYLASSVFNHSQYRSMNRDLAHLTNHELELHWLNHGMKAGRIALHTFSSKEYLKLYPDLRNAFGTDSVLAINHYLNYGLKGGRVGRILLSPLVYDDIEYRSRYGDLSQFSTSDLGRHWVLYGSKAGRMARNDFSSKAYLLRYGDLVRAYGSDGYQAATSHYVNFGFNEGRNGKP